MAENVRYVIEDNTGRRLMLHIHGYPDQESVVFETQEDAKKIVMELCLCNIGSGDEDWYDIKSIGPAPEDKKESGALTLEQEDALSKVAKPEPNPTQKFKFSSKESGV